MIPGMTPTMRDALNRSNAAESAYEAAMSAAYRKLLADEEAAIGVDARTLTPFSDEYIRAWKDNVDATAEARRICREAFAAADEARSAAIKAIYRDYPRFYMEGVA